jgi:hypothetical protein
MPPISLLIPFPRLCATSIPDNPIEVANAIKKVLNAFTFKFLIEF